MSLLRKMKQKAREMGIDPSTIRGRTAEETSGDVIRRQNEHATAKRAELERKVGPHATKFVDLMLNILENKGGIHDEEARRACGYEMNEIIRSESNSLFGPNPDATLIKMAHVLKKYGVEDEVVQEDIILDFMKTLKDLAEIRLAGGR